MASQGSKTGSKSKSRSSNGRSSSNKSSSRSKSSGGSSKSSGGNGNARKPGDGQGPPSRRPDRKQSGSRSKTQKYDDYAVSDPREIGDGPDVLIDVPVVKVDEVDF